MKVPHNVRPQTQQPSTPIQYLDQRASPEAFGAGIGRALQGFGLALNAEAEKVDNEAKRRAMFDVNMRHSEESLNAAQDFAKRAADAPLGAEGFTKQILADYEKRHADIIANMEANGAPREAIEAMQLKLADLRGGLVSQSIRFQQQSYETKVAGDTQKIALNLSQLASMNPDEMSAATEELNEAIDAIPNLDAVSKQKLKDEYGGSIRLAAGYGRAQQQPQRVIELLTGQRPGAAGGYYAAVRKGESGNRGTAKNPRSSAEGFYQWLDSTWAGLVRRYPNAGLTLDGRGDAQQEEVAIRLFTNENAQALGRARISGTDANLYAAHFLGAGGAITVLSAPNSVPVSSLVGADVMAANPHLRGMTVGYFKAWTQRVVGTGGGMDPTAPLKTGKVGDEVLDALTPAERAQVLSQARTVFNQQQANYRADLGQRVENATAAFLQTGEYNGRMPSRDEFFAAYDPVEAEQRWAAFKGARATGEFIRDMKVMTADEIAAKVQSMLPQDTSSPTYARELEAFTAAQNAQQALLKQRQDDPAGYVTTHYPAVQEAWQSATDAEGRQAAFAAMAEAYRMLGMRPSQMVPYPKGALDAERERFASFTPEQKVSALEQMRVEMGPMFQNGLAQLAENGMNTEAYLAGLIAQSPAHGSVAANVLRGMQILADDPSRRPSADQINEQFRGELGNVLRMLSPSAADAMNKAATALYVFEGGDPKVVDQAGYAKALRQVLGGSADDDTTGLVDMTDFGSNVDFETILPPGVNQAQMESWQSGLDEATLLRLGNGRPTYSTGEQVAPEDIAADGVLVRVSPDEFVVLMESDGKPLMNENGEYFRMRVSPEEVLRAERFGEELGRMPGAISPNP